MNRDCKVCLAPHDEEIHAATDRVHRWFRAQVKKYMNEPVDDARLAEGEGTATPQFDDAGMEGRI